jgi:bifunctional pyridoxal-dependent enzyme with beta-cystathionase and maltose regulon repressor activities
MQKTPGSKWHRDPPEVIPLWLADPDFPLEPSIKKGLIHAIQDEHVYYNTDNHVREVMAKKIHDKNGLDVTFENVMLTQGVIPAMWLAIRHTCSEGDEVVVTNPMYFPFFIATEVTNTKPLYWDLYLDEGYKFNIERFKELVSPKTRLLFVCNPHNPCGRVMTKEELKGIAEVCVDHGIKVMVDELWEDILFDGRKHITLASLDSDIADITMTSWGFSKTWGVAGLQMGYLCSTNMDMMEDLRRRARGIMRGSNTLARYVAPIMLSDSLDYWKLDMIDHLENIRGICRRRLEEMGNIEIPKLEGTYLMFPKFNYDKTSEELLNLFLKEAKVRFSQGSTFGTKGEKHLRMCIATSVQIINEALDRVEKTISKL